LSVLPAVTVFFIGVPFPLLRPRLHVCSFRRWDPIELLVQYWCPV
jgi:hypothetical protein